MKQRKKGYGILLGLTILFTLAALSTLYPHASASKPNLLGYKSLCTNAPVSTVVVLVLAAFTCLVRSKNFTVK